MKRRVHVVCSAFFGISALTAQCGIAFGATNRDAAARALPARPLALITSAPTDAATPESMEMPGMQDMQNMPGQKTISEPVQSKAGPLNQARSTMATMQMRSAVNLADPMSRAGSGTSWVPDSTQVFGYMQMRDGRMTMEHFAAFPRYAATGSQRGSRRADLPNWGMGMYAAPLGNRSQIGVNAMLSLDPLTENGQGYPLLFQSGETWHGQPLHDRQHPHDFFSELSATVSTRISQRGSAYVYAGYPGEPALGPPTFMHRRIAYDMPDAPIGHHWQDATHVTFGTLTAGIAGPGLKFEASTFTGSEPNAARYNFDPIHLDSYATRLSWIIGKNLAGQVSHGFLHAPESTQPNVDVHRATASLLYNHKIARDHNVYTAITFGQNYEPGSSRTNSYLFEFDYQKNRNSYYMRAERTGKTGAELALPTGDQVAFVGHVTAGYIREVARPASTVDAGLGLQISRGIKPLVLDPYYGAGIPYSYEVFLRLRPREL